MTMRPTILPASEWPFRVVPHTVAFVRHGEKNGSGFSADLTEKGYSDAVLAGSRIRYPVNLFLSSPSPRTVSTAKGICEGNGSSAAILEEDQLAEPGLGLCIEQGPAMKSFFRCILGHIDDRRADIAVAVTHNYVVEYVADAFGCVPSQPGYLSGIVVNIEDLMQIAESRRG